MPRALDSVDPIISGPGNAIGPEGPVGPPGPPGNQPFDIQIFSGEGATTQPSPVRFGSRYLDLTPFPAIHPSGLNRVIEFVANIETTAGLANIRLRNRDDGETVTGTALNTPSLTSVEVRSGPLTVGVAVGDLKDDKMYEVEVFISGGAPTDAATCTNARLEISYV
jgi:hypothetical protein